MALIHLYLAAINSDRCPDALAALALLIPILALLMVILAGMVAIS